MVHGKHLASQVTQRNNEINEFQNILYDTVLNENNLPDCWNIIWNKSGCIVAFMKKNVMQDREQRSSEILQKREILGRAYSTDIL